jgi:hypothetical protein
MALLDNRDFNKVKKYFQYRNGTDLTDEDLQKLSIYIEKNRENRVALGGSFKQKRDLFKYGFYDKLIPSPHPYIMHVSFRLATQVIYTYRSLKLSRKKRKTILRKLGLQISLTSRFDADSPTLFSHFWPRFISQTVIIGKTKTTRKSPKTICTKSQLHVVLKLWLILLRIT